MGAGRAGWYSYDFIDNGGEPSAVEIRPELQHIGVGTVLPDCRERRTGSSLWSAIRNVLLCSAGRHPTARTGPRGRSCSKMQGRIALG